MVAYTMEAVCILMGCKPNWKESKNLLSKMTFMDELKVCVREAHQSLDIEAKHRLLFLGDGNAESS